MRSTGSSPDLNGDNRDDGQVEGKREQGDGQRQRRTAFAQVDEILRRVVRDCRPFFDDVGQLPKRVVGGATGGGGGGEIHGFVVVFIRGVGSGGGYQFFLSSLKASSSSGC